MATAATALKDTKTNRPAHISEEEWELRVQLAAAYRVFDHLGWTLVIFNHLTARVPGPDHHFLINPFGLRYDEVTASNLVKIDLEGNKIDDSPYGVNPAGFVIHSGIHSAVPEAMCVMHTHTTEGLAVAMKKHGLRNENFYSAMIGDHVAYHDFEGITEREDEKPRLLASMGNKPFLILRNHGLLTHGRTVAEAFIRMWTLQLACEAQVMADSMQGENIPVSPEATKVSTETARLVGANDPGGEDTFNALVRVIEQKDPSYKS
jgi:ribulose-5-phosphate 4-epimerase/fuculose-1-phosphate aldolase